MGTRATGSRTIPTRILVWWALVSCAVPAASAQVIGNVAAYETNALLGRSGNWSALSLGAEIQMGDQVRTDESGRVTISFVDGSVAVISDESDLVIDQFVYDPVKAGGASLLELLKGRVRTIVSDYYSDAGKFDVKTPTAIAGVRGTDFVVIYDDAVEVTEVIGATGRVYVQSLSLAADPGVLITAGTQTSIAKGQPPTTPQRLGEERFQHYMQDLEFIGRGGRQGVGFNQPVLSGSDVPEPDRASAGLSGAAAGVDLDQLQQGDGNANAVGLAGEPPSALDFGRVGVEF